MTTNEQPSATDPDVPMADGANRGSAEVSPLKGGRWRPIRPDELLRKNSMAEETPPVPVEPKVRLARRQELEHHLRTRPTDLPGYLELASIYRDEDRPLEARRTLEQAHKIFPEDQDILWELEEATLARSMQQFREVTDLANRLGTKEADRELQRSRSDWAARRMEICRARLERDPTLEHLRMIIAEAMMDAGMYAPALEECKAMLHLDEFSPQAHLIRGNCYMHLGQEIEAMVEFRAAALRRAVVAPAKVRIVALRSLCELADRLGVTLTHQRYLEQLALAENEAAGV